MATTLLLLLLSAILTAEAQQGESIVSLGSFFTPETNSSWLSSSGLYAFGFYQQTNGYAIGVFLAGIPEKIVIWTANRDNPPTLADVALNFISDGRLILQSAKGNETDIVNAPERATSASMLNSGNFALYKSDQSTGIFQLVMQTDGNLVQYSLVLELKPEYAYWSSVTFGNNASLCLDDDGQDTFCLMRIDADGILRLYSHNLVKNGSWLVIWPSSNDKCDPKGLCGLNGFCTNADQEANCLSSRIWTYSAFSILQLLQKEDCEAACLEDCNCEAAMYKDGSFQKQRLPLRFGRRQLSDTNIAFIKVPTYTSTINKIAPMELEKKSLIIGIPLAAFGIIMSVISGIAIYRNHVGSYKGLSNSGNVGLSVNVSPRSFTYSDLEKMTNGFKQELVRGSFGTVYKKTIWNGQKLVAIKRLEKVLAEGEKEFQTEMKVIGRTHHKNLVHLLGYCQEGEDRLLVYEYMCNGSLADILFTPEKQPSWDERIEITWNVTRGILYLREECESQIIHCDIKPQKILIDEYKSAKIYDSGLAKLLKPNQTNTFTGIRGTKGYVAPEWNWSQHVTFKANVYSFGILLLDLICCRKCVDWNLPEEEAILEEWAYHCFEARKLDKLASGKEVEKIQLERMKVLLMLEGTVDIPIPPSSTSFLSTV
ncbi:hypothetical protein ACJW31_10G129400 [Castanea mollissima]